MSISPVGTVLEVARPECATEVLEEEVVALNVETGIYISMRGLCAALWHDLEAGHPVEMLAEHAQQQGDRAERVTEFADQVRRHGLMRVSAPRPAVGGFASTEMLRGGTQETLFEVYDDMQDLILSDPVHDVDDAGWPARKAQNV
jgi:hypothetical protein